MLVPTQPLAVQQNDTHVFPLVSGFAAGRPILESLDAPDSPILGWQFALQPQFSDGFQGSH